MSDSKPKQTEFTVFATVTLRGAWMVVDATSEAEAKEIAKRAPDFEINGAELSDWEIEYAVSNEGRSK